MRVYLASASPRRRELLEQIGVKFTIIPAQGEEIIRSTDPKLVVMDLAKQKAGEIYGMQRDQNPTEDMLVIGADTVVACQGEILGKPKDEADARRMLSILQNGTHQVYTGVALLWKENGVDQEKVFYHMTEVTMYPMSEQEIQAYIASGEPMDKAGAYGIQGRCAAFIEKIHGDYNNVVGLPVAQIYQELRKLGIDICAVS